ncbi:hypothetical protein F4823DRAFT_578905 [Ustulina deusta]|nr:hypothetical protein F4823DRAFT_578905 [Ustulina deusta]
MVAVAGNCRGDKVIALLVELGKQVQVTDTVLAAAAENEYCGREIIALLEKAGKKV